MRLAACLLALVASSAAAGTPVAMSLTVGRGAVVDCPQGVARVATSNPDAVDAVAASDHEVLFQAKALGQATLLVWSRKGERTVYEVTVEPNLEPLRQLLKETFPHEQLELKATRESLSLVGRASSRAVAERALALVAASVKGAVANLEIAPPPPERQILLRVRFAELSRSATSALAVNLLSSGNTIGRITTGQSASGTLSQMAAGVDNKFALSDLLNIFAFRPDLNLGVLIQDLQSRGLLQVLAEPNLVATNGHEASFLAGGEFPVPIVQGGANAGAITVQFHEFGIRLSFLPEITPNQMLHLHVRPEVSSIDPSNGVTVSGFRIPALSTRRIETDVELAQGQSFVIAGLLDQRVTQDLSKIPGLSGIPVFGWLFQSHSVTKSNTELIVVVTPEFTKPITGAAKGPDMPEPFLGPAKEKSK